ncbi:hypothetical protein LOK49_LG05G03071 [Camellia lanceoleosa]|uniref:Uncharacterized protein n=1 Tax=Camellia lanceoleosa TaxID=1840588 RepID=A0ACC0HJV9_9ERIC|nr:hypothetical protein LOK49_LG05G03071 [Camellia lanceoleosa]
MVMVVQDDKQQGRYCSNLYPKAESYRVCNWCLSDKKKDTAEKTQNHLNSEDTRVIKKKKKNDNHGGLKKGHKGNLQLQVSSPIKKQRLPEESPSVAAARKRTTTGGGGGGSVEKRLRRTKSEEISNNGGIITKQVFRNKVRRYKLLDEVSSQ